MPSNTYNIFLIKDNVNSFNEVLTKGAIEKLQNNDSHIISDFRFTDNSELYILSGIPSSPKWLNQLNSAFNIDISVNSRSTSGILFFEASKRLFAATFGHGWMYLDPSFLVNDFGLRASINAIDEEKLNRLERTNLGDALRASALSPFKRTFSSFGLNDALELVRTISGATKENVEGHSMSGSKSLKITGEFDISHLPDLAKEALFLFNSNNYKNTTFAILDVLRPVSDYAIIESLNKKAATHIMSADDNFELGLPGNHVDEGVYYQFSGISKRGHFSDLRLINYIDALGNELDKLTLKTLKSHSIIANYDDASKPNQSWSIHKSLVGSMEYINGLYAINEGMWYSINDTFKTSVNTRFEEVVKPFTLKHLPLIKKITENGKKEKFETELEYNTRCAEEYNYILLDQRLINVPSMQNQKFEACDLLDIENKKFIHVKKSSRSSSILSHFFKQGSNSAKNFKTYPDCMEQLREKIISYYGRPKVMEFDNAIANNKRWTVEFWIIDKTRKNGEFNIPFFSKISLKDEVANMASMDYDVVLKFINQN